MPDFGFGFRGRQHHHHHHHPRPWDQGGGGDFAPPPLDDDGDFGCDPHLQAPLDATHVRWLQNTLSRMQMNFGQDEDDDAQEPDDGSQGGVLDAVSQVASGVADMIAPSAAPEAYIPPPIPVHHHRRHHHPMDPLAYQLYGRPFYHLSHHERERLERERIARLEHERRHGHHPYYGRGGRWHGDDFGVAMYTAPPAYPTSSYSPPAQVPAQRYGQGGYRPRGQGRFNQGGGGGHGYGHGHGGHGYGHGHGHGHHHQLRGGGYQGGPQQGGPQALPPGSYQQSCSGCTFDGNTLSCTCTDTDGHNQPASLLIPVANNQGISNHAGVLVLSQT